MKTFNINETVGFKVTKHGKQILKKYHYKLYDSFADRMKKYLDEQWKSLESLIDNNEYIWKQMHEVMNIFGTSMGFDESIEMTLLIKEQSLNEYEQTTNTN